MVIQTECMRLELSFRMKDGPLGCSEFGASSEVAALQGWLYDKEEEFILLFG